jgi:hypothetical protein
MSKTLTTGNRRAGRPSDSGSIAILVPIAARPDTQISFAEINPEARQVSNGGRQWSVSYRQYWAAPPVRAGKCQEL